MPARQLRSFEATIIKSYLEEEDEDSIGKLLAKKKDQVAPDQKRPLFAHGKSLRKTRHTPENVYVVDGHSY